MIGSVTERLAPDADFLVFNGTNVTEEVDIVSRDLYRVQVAAATTVLGGLIQVSKYTPTQTQINLQYTVKTDVQYLQCMNIKIHIHTVLYLLIGYIRLGAVWLCGHVSLRAAGQRLYHGSIFSCCSSPVKVHPRSLTQTL